MKKKVLLFSSAAFLSAGALFGFTPPSAKGGACPLESGSAGIECPVMPNCPTGGTAACTAAGMPDCCAMR